MIRKREIRRASDLLRGLLAWVLGRWSYRSLACWSVLLGIADISERAWRKRIRHCGDWLAWVLSRLCMPLPEVSQTKGKRLCLVDGTTLGHVGGTGDDWRLQFTYDLVEGCLVDVRLGDQKMKESLVGIPTQPGDLLVADRYYGKRENLASVEAAQSYSLCRLAPHQCSLEEEDGQAFSVLSWLQTQPEEQRVCEYRSMVRVKEQRVAVRVMGLPLPEQAAAKARARALLRGRRKRQQVQPQTLFLAGWVLLVSTLPQEQWSCTELFWLYRQRWQIELLFKRLKQFLLLVRLNSCHPETVRATLLAALVGWMLQEQEMQEVLRVLEQEQAPDLIQAYLPLVEQWIEEDPPVPETLPMVPAISVWTISSAGLTRWRSMVWGLWSLERLRQCLPSLQRLFCPSARRRIHQRLAFRAWVQRFFSAKSPHLPTENRGPEP
ncbi:MAG TPA: transposase [Ktedonobacteraceae bacterium]|nr:transposase [Ktedonobacteraceae bacterium]